MRDDAEPYALTLTLGDYLEVTRAGAKRARAAAGWTSIRIDNKTAEKLREIASSLPKVLGFEWRNGIMLVELLALVSRTTVVPIAGEMHAVPANKVSGSAVHAKRRRSPRPPAKHAKQVAIRKRKAS